MKLGIAQVIGLNTDQKAAQALSTVREGDSFLGVLQITCDDAFTKARQILSELQDFYYEEEGTISQKLNATFAEADKKLAETESWDLGLAVVSNKILYLIGKGEIKVYLKRNGQISSLLDVGGQNQLISGFIQEGDRVFLTTETLNSFLSSDLEQSLELPLAGWEEEISNRMSDATLDVQGLAGLLLETQPDVPQPVEPTSQAPIPVLGHTSAEDNLHSYVPQPSNVPAPEFKNPLPQLLASLGKLIPRRKNEYYADTSRNWKGILPTSGRGRLILAVILLVVLGLGVGFKVKRDSDKQTNLAFAADLQQAQDDYNAAQNLKTLNPAEAKNKLDSAKKQVNKALGLKPKDSRALDLKNQINQNADAILQQFAASEFPVFMDLDLIKKDFRPIQMSLSGTKLLLLDPGVKTLVAIDITKKSNQTLAGSDQMGDAKFASINGGIGFVYSQNKGVLRVDTTNQKVTTVAKQDSGWGQIKDLTGFAGNVYLLDSDKNQIWKYLPTSAGYSDKRNYLNDGVKVDLGSAVRMQIESSVYILKSGGEMIRLTKGAPDNFSYGGLDTGIKNPKSFFVSSDTDNLYLLDSGNSRLLVLGKTGQYKSQYKGDRFGSATDLVVDEQNKKVYLLDGGKIYSTDLK